MNSRFTSMKHGSAEGKKKATSNFCMERGALVFALALTLPLFLYGVPYAYAAQMSSAYTVSSLQSAPAGSSGSATAMCSFGDYLTGGGFVYNNADPLVVTYSAPTLPFGANQDTWLVVVRNPDTVSSHSFYAVAICQKPITVAGIGVPEFGSLYVAIALGAVVYFMLSRRFARQPAISAQV